MCPYPKMTREKVNMNMPLFKKIIDEAKDIGIEEICLSFYNEPFLDKLLFQRIKYVKQKNMRVVFFSNGTLLDDSIINDILKYVPDIIYFSFDSYNKKDYERIRIGGNFEKTRSNILKLIKERNRLKMKKPFIQVNLIHMNKNDNELDEFIKYWNSKADAIDLGALDNREEISKLKLKVKTKHG